MSSFNREDFAVRSKSELLDYIEQQSDQISRLETRFRGEAGASGQPSGHRLCVRTPIDRVLTPAIVLINTRTVHTFCPKKIEVGLTSNFRCVH